MAGPTGPMGELAELRGAALACTRCALAAGRTQVVFGVGDPGAELMFVGEAPGRDEDLAGEPFVGRSGKLLDMLMAQELGIDRTRCYVANVVKCLRHDAPVQLADGSWEAVGRLVERRYDGAVKSVDRQGRLVDRRVTGWHESPLAGRRVFRLSYRSAQDAPAGAPAGIEATGDHEVLTEGGWIRVDRLAAGASIATGLGLSPVAHDVVVGSLLGGAQVSFPDGRLQMAYPPGLVPYATFKASLLSELGALVQTGRGGSAVAPGGAAARLRTVASPAVRAVAHDFRRAGGTQVPVWVADALTPRSLAVWFLDAGRISPRASRRPRAEIAARAVDTAGLDVLRKGLARLGLSAEVGAGRVCFGRRDTRVLARTIAPYVPPSMRGRLPGDVEARCPFDAARFDDTGPAVQFDEAVVHEVAGAGVDETFYCIDVEETHNFVTAGGVVHNCRPPGNRDPLPAEITACRPYLDRQIALIRPSVVVTLGNFATRVLLDTAEGITRLRGRAYPFATGHVVPTYHPAAALRGGGEKVAEMRADFVRAKGLLGRGGRRGAP